MNETWLSSDIQDREVSIDSFNLIRKDGNHHGAGIAVYIKNCLPFKPLHLSYPDLELVPLECIINSRIVTVLAFYQPPNSSSQCPLVASCTKFFKFICGDFNLDPRTSAPL